MVRWCSTGVVQLIRNQQVVSSNLTTSSKKGKAPDGAFPFLELVYGFAPRPLVRARQAAGRAAEEKAQANRVCGEPTAERRLASQPEVG